MFCTARSACSLLSTPLKITPIKPMSKACFAIHWALSLPYGGNRANAATFGCALPLEVKLSAELEDPSLHDGVRVIHGRTERLDGGQDRVRVEHIERVELQHQPP